MLNLNTLQSRYLLSSIKYAYREMLGETEFDDRYIYGVDGINSDEELRDIEMNGKEFIAVIAHVDEKTFELFRCKAIESKAGCPYEIKIIEKVTHISPKMSFSIHSVQKNK